MLFSLHELCLSQLDHPLNQALVCGKRWPGGEIKNLIINYNLIHLFVVSGAHALFFERGLKRIGFNKFFQVLTLGLYTLCCNFSSPISRCFIERLIVLTAKHLHLYLPSQVLKILSGFLCLPISIAKGELISLLLSVYFSQVVSSILNSKESLNSKGLPFKSLNSENLNSKGLHSESLNSESLNSKGLPSKSLNSESLNSKGLPFKSLNSESLNSKGFEFKIILISLPIYMAVLGTPPFSALLVLSLATPIIGGILLPLSFMSLVSDNIEWLSHCIWWFLLDALYYVEIFFNFPEKQPSNFENSPWILIHLLTLFIFIHFGMTLWKRKLFFI